MGLFCGGLDDGLTGDQGSCQHDIYGSAHGSKVKANPVSMQALLTRLQRHVFFSFIHHRAQSLKPLDMLVDGAGGKIAAAGQSHTGLAKPAQQRTHQVVAGPHPSYQLPIRL